MKNTIIFSTVIIFALLAVVWVGFTEFSDRDRVQQKTIDYLNKRIKEQADSLTKQLTLTRDSLQIAFNSIRLAAIEREQAHLRTQRIIRNYEKIIFIGYSNDSARHRKLKQLFPSYE